MVTADGDVGADRHERLYVGRSRIERHLIGGSRWFRDSYTGFVGTWLRKVCRSVTEDMVGVSATIFDGHKGPNGIDTPHVVERIVGAIGTCCVKILEGVAVAGWDDVGNGCDDEGCFCF